MPSKEGHESMDPAAMESTKGMMDEAKQQAEPPSASTDDQANAAAAADLLSGLCDDVLVHILGLSKHARDAVRTGALSRRWRGLWRRVPALRFVLRHWLKLGGNAQGFMAFVDDTLALRTRSGDGGLEKLEIRLDRSTAARGNERLVQTSIGAAERWIRYSVRHGVKSFRFRLDLPNNHNDEEALMVLDELPSSAKLEAMYLDLSDAWVSLPATVVFASLRDLELEFVKVAGDNVLNLGRLVSSVCCPNLRKLDMSSVTLAEPGQQKLLVEAGVLQELSLYGMDGMRSLELRAPSLRVLRIKECKDLELLAASTPRLEKLISYEGNPLLTIDGDFPSVSHLKLDLDSHGDASGDDSNYGSIELLQRCRSTSRLSINLHASMSKSDDIDITKGRIPQLDHVRSLKVRISPTTAKQSMHSVVGCVASLFTSTSFSNIRYLCLDFLFFEIYEISVCPGAAIWKSNFICDHQKSHEISFIHLREAEFRRMRGTECELGLLQYVLSGATQLQKVVLRFNQASSLNSTMYTNLNSTMYTNFRKNQHSLKSRRNDFLEKLLASGTWTDGHDTTDKYRSYEWRPCQ